MSYRQPRRGAGVLCSGGDTVLRMTATLMSGDPW